MPFDEAAANGARVNRRFSVAARKTGSRLSVATGSTT
jgi:hypothetical protein